MLNFNISANVKTVSCCTPQKLFTPTLSRLLFLEKQFEYVFHGSPFRLEKLDPKQALDYRFGSQVKDGPPAVFASHLLQYAIFKALINPVNCRTCLFKASINCNNGELHFAASQGTLIHLSAMTRGYVHVLPRSAFFQRSDNEWLRHGSVRPVAVFEVRLADFHGDIEVLA